VKQFTARTLCKKVHHAGLILLVTLAVGACSVPFEWAGSMPESWGESAPPESTDSGANSGTGTISDDGASESGSVDPAMIEVNGPSFTLAWDSDDANVAEFRLYRREYGTDAWQPLAAGITATSHEITTAALDYGSYEFAVSAVGTDGVETSLHASSDEDATPGPWAIVWSA